MEKISEIATILSAQIAGRVAGLIFGLIPLYFYNPQIFLPAAAGTILLPIKHIPRIKGYLSGKKLLNGHDLNS